MRVVKNENGGKDLSLVEKSPSNAVKIGLADAFLVRIRWVHNSIKINTDLFQNHIRFVRI